MVAKYNENSKYFRFSESPLNMGSRKKSNINGRDIKRGGGEKGRPLKKKKIFSEIKKKNLTSLMSGGGGG